MRVFEIGVAARGEGPDEVQRCRRLPIGIELALRIGRAGTGRELDIVDDIAAIARELDAADLFQRSRPGLGELPGDAPDLHHRRGGGERHHDRHLQEDAKEIANVVGGVLGETLGAVAALKQESLAGRDFGERPFQLARLACKNQRREAGERPLHFG